MIDTKQALIAYLNQGNTVEFLPFWGHTPKHPNQIDKSCLSQWFPASFTLDEITYPTAEHYMMAEKARLFNDEAILQAILTSDTPQQAKTLGREVKNFNVEVWDQACVAAVVRGNQAKFAQHAALKDYLLSTGDTILVEASPLDTIWGIGLGSAHSQVTQPEKWRGLNLLGFALMQVREALRQSA